MANLRCSAAEESEDTLNSFTSNTTNEQLRAEQDRSVREDRKLAQNTWDGRRSQQRRDVRPQQHSIRRSSRHGQRGYNFMRSSQWISQLQDRMEQCGTSVLKMAEMNYDECRSEDSPNVLQEVHRATTSLPCWCETTRNQQVDNR